MENTATAQNTALSGTTSQTQTQTQTQTPTPTPTPTPTGPQTQTLTFSEKLDAAEDHWIWKVALRGLVLLLSVIGIGCLGWAVSSAASNANSAVFLSDQYFLWWTLITFGISIIWTTLCILILFLRRPHRPIHPGVAVGMDLVLWLAYIPTTMFAVFALIALLDFAAAASINQSSADGYYTQAANGTWLYNATEYMAYYHQPRTCNSSASRTPYAAYGGPMFDSCEAQDAFVNALWVAAKHRTGVVLTGTVCQGLVLLLHFALFVWACVDTQRRNSRKVRRDAEMLAADIIGRMVREGAIVGQTGPYRLLRDGDAGLSYEVHAGPPPPAIHVTEHYAPAAREKGEGRVVEHYGGSEKARAGPEQMA